MKRRGEAFVRNRYRQGPKCGSRSLLRLAFMGSDCTPVSSTTPGMSAVKLVHKMVNRYEAVLVCEGAEKTGYGVHKQEFHVLAWSVLHCGSAVADFRTVEPRATG